MRARDFIIESETKAFIRKHTPWVQKELGLKDLPNIVLQNSLDDTTFGKYVPEKKTLFLATANRHPVDVLRTMAHELTHYKQDLEGRTKPDSGETGSAEENEANSVAGIIMRHFNQEHPEFLKMTIDENMDHDKDGQAVDELKAALDARRNEILKVKDDKDKVYKIIDGIMTSIAKAHGMSGQKIHDLWVAKYKEIPDTWIMNEDEETTPKPHLFLDMDGVQADFFHAWAKWEEVNHYKDISDSEASITRMSQQGPKFVEEFFTNLPQLNGGKQIVEWAHKNNIPFTVLSAPLRGQHQPSIAGKRAWLDKYVPGSSDSAVFTAAKFKYATSDGHPNVLVDDFGKYINAWREHGGIGIKHDDSNTADTIRQLEEIYLKDKTNEDISRRNLIKGGIGLATGVGAADVLGKELKQIKVADNENSRILLNIARKYITGTELAQFMAQCAHETANFSTLVEIGGPNHFKKYDPQFNPKKAKELGNVKPGDGERYKGRGFLQITGRDNYKRMGDLLKMPLEDNPRLIENPEYAAWASILFWFKQVRNKVNNFNNTKQATKPINPGLHGLEDRKEKFNNYQTALNVHKAPSSHKHGAKTTTR